MTEELSYVGIDVAKARVDVAVRPSGDIWSEDYNEAGIEGLVVRLQTLGPAAVVLEATGGLEAPLVSALAAGGSACDSGQPPAGAGFRQGHRPAGQDRRIGRSGAGPFCRGGASRPSGSCGMPTPRNSLP